MAASISRRRILVCSLFTESEITRRTYRFSGSRRAVSSSPCINGRDSTFVSRTQHPGSHTPSRSQSAGLTQFRDRLTIPSFARILKTTWFVRPSFGSTVFTRDAVRFVSLSRCHSELGIRSKNHYRRAKKSEAFKLSFLRRGRRFFPMLRQKRNRSFALLRSFKALAPKPQRWDWPLGETSTKKFCQILMAARLGTRITSQN